MTFRFSFHPRPHLPLYVCVAFFGCKMHLMSCVFSPALFPLLLSHFSFVFYFFLCFFFQLSIIRKILLSNGCSVMFTEREKFENISISAEETQNLSGNPKLRSLKLLKLILEKYPQLVTYLLWTVLWLEIWFFIFHINCIYDFCALLCFDIKYAGNLSAF